MNLRGVFARLLSFLVPGWLSAGEPGLEIVVHPPVPLTDGHRVELRLESGERVELVRDRTGAFRGTLEGNLRRKAFQPLLVPGDHPEAGAGGQMVPPRAAGSLDAPVWIFPAAWRGQDNPPGHPYRRGLHEDLEVVSPRVPAPRPVRVHLPRAYAASVSQRFPVVYLLDGQNVFDASTAYPGVEWNADEVAEALEAAGEPPAILVGIDNGGGRRMSEYTFCKDPRQPGGGGAAEHLAFLLQDVIPMIEGRYRCLPGRRFLVGSSLGGLFALWTALAHPGAFEGVAAMSPSLWWNQGAVLKLDAAPGPRSRVWIDMGTKEGDSGRTALSLAVERLTRAGWVEGPGLKPLLVEGGMHHESAWAMRMPQVLRFFLDDGR